MKLARTGATISGDGGNAGRDAAHLVIVGRGLIGGSLLLAARRAGVCAAAYDRGETPDVSAADTVFIAVPPSAVASVVDALAPRLAPGTAVVDMTGVKGCLCGALAAKAAAHGFVFVGGHPMAGKERTGFANACADLFDGASMILVPSPAIPPDLDARLERLFADLGFARVVRTDAAHHDAMIAFTSQLCHLISSAYVREPLAAEHAGYSAGSFRDMVRVGAPDPDIWTELFTLNRAALLPVLERYIARLTDFRDALAADDRARLHAALAEGVAAKARLRG